MKLTPEQLTAYLQAADILANIGGLTVRKIRAMFTAAGLSDADLNAVLEGIKQNAIARKKIADADAGENPTV